jgi:hypothetical protein
MVFSDPTGGNGLVQDVDFICSTDSTSYPLKDKARNFNRHYYVVVSDIMEVAGRGQFHDSNLTTVQDPTFTLVAGQSQYTLPSEMLLLEGVEIQDNGGNWIRLQEIDTEELRRTVTDFEETDGTPKYYDLRGDSIYLYPAPAEGSVTLTNGGKLLTTREFDPFTDADTTQEPGFAEPYHRILSLGASYDYLCINGTGDKADRVLAQYNALRAECRKFYAERNKDIHVGFRPAHRTSNYL